MGIGLLTLSMDIMLVTIVQRDAARRRRKAGTHAPDRKQRPCFGKQQ